MATMIFVLALFLFCVVPFSFPCCSAFVFVFLPFTWIKYGFVFRQWRNTHFPKRTHTLHKMTTKNLQEGLADTRKVVHHSILQCCLDINIICREESSKGKFMCDQKSECLKYKKQYLDKPETIWKQLLCGMMK